MDIKNIKQLVKILNESGLSGIEITEGENKIRLEKTGGQETVYATAIAPAAIPAAVTELPVTAKAGKEIDFNNIKEFKSPIIGVFYAAASPADKPFVEIGSRVKKGDVLCIVEAMKVMNEIVSDCDGEIVDICAQNGQLVEYSQVLFKIF